MVDSVLLELEAKPSSIAEWEDLLVRLELMPRAVLHAVDDAGDGAAVRSILGSMVERERAASSWLLALSGATAEVTSSPAPPEADARELRERFAGLRARTFAIVQRRGLEVWGWEGETEHGRRTVYQALVGLVRADVRALADLRATTHPARTPC